MKQNDRALKKYYQEISMWLPCSGKEKKYILQNIKTNLNDYLLNNPSASTQDIENHFGSAKMIASSYIDITDCDNVLQSLRIRRIIKRSILAVAAAIILLWGCVVGWAAVREWKATNGWQTTVITEETP